MCGIVGYSGYQQAQPILLRALARLEYRGYDSSGVAVRGKSIQIVKDTLRVENLAKTCPVMSGTIGIGHTRWATHGEPSRLNAHPHQDCTGKIVVVHNGVISNYQSLKDQLIREGHIFISETDTEVIPHLIEKYYLGDLETATLKAMEKLEGSFAIAVVAEQEDKIVAAKNGSPLVVGVADQEYVIASDISAVLDTTNRVIYLEDGDLAAITSDGIRLSNGGKSVTRKIFNIAWNVENVQKGVYEHFMIKEIHEEPRVIQDTLQENQSTEMAARYTRLANNKPDIGSILILACGTSYHAGLLGKYIFEEMTDIPMHVEIASEINHRDHVTRVTNAIAITQSGETADVLLAMRKLKERGSHVSVITNNRESSAGRLADETIYTSAGPEVSVAATKSFIAQLIALYKLVLASPGANLQTRENLGAELDLMPDKVQQLLEDQSQIIESANFLAQHSNAFFIGRGVNFPTAMEGALKLKEISYMHAEGYAAGELKHGPFSLLQYDTPVVAIVSLDKTFDPMLTNIKEIKARKAPVIAVISEEDRHTHKLADYCIRVPRTAPILSPVVNSVALQLLAYYAARARSCPIDFPRNLAKSVTVE